MRWDREWLVVLGSLLVLEGRSYNRRQVTNLPYKVALFVLRRSGADARILLPHSRMSMHLHFCDFSRSSFMSVILRLKASSSAIFLPASLCMRIESGASSRKPLKSSRHSARVKPQSFANSKTERRSMASTSYRRCPLVRLGLGSNPDFS